VNEQRGCKHYLEDQRYQRYCHVTLRAGRRRHREQVGRGVQQDRDQDAALRSQEHIGEDQRFGHQISQQQPQRLSLHRGAFSPDQWQVPQPPVEPEDQAGSDSTVADEEPGQQVATPAKLFAESVGECQDQQGQRKCRNR
jgi:hypothetical protein